MFEKSEKKIGRGYFFWKSSQMFEKSENKSGEVIFFEIVSKKSQNFSALRAKTYWFCLKIWSKIPKIFRRFAPDTILIFSFFLLGGGYFFWNPAQIFKKIRARLLILKFFFNLTIFWDSEKNMKSEVIRRGGGFNSISPVTLL